MRVLVTGGRNFCDRAFLNKELDKLHFVHDFTTLVHGDANGVDRLAGAWAREWNIPVEVYPANWSLHGRSAGIIRNAEMLKTKPALVVAFPGGRGTANMVMKSRQARIPVIIVGGSEKV
jgi:hypothetical protein